MEDVGQQVLMDADARVAHSYYRASRFCRSCGFVIRDSGEDMFTLDEVVGLEDLRASGFTVSIERVPYEFQRGGNEMMRVRAGTGRFLR